MELNINSKSIERFISTASTKEFKQNVIEAHSLNDSIEKVYAVLRFTGGDNKVEVLKQYFNKSEYNIIEVVNKFKNDKATVVKRINILVDDFKRKKHFRKLQRVPVYAMTNEIRGFQTCSVE